MALKQEIGKHMVTPALMLLLQSAVLAATQGDAPGRTGTSTSATALLLCCEADQLSGAEKQRALMRGLELAQDAAAADPADPQAHFAVFCNLGKQMQSGPLESRGLGELGRLRREIDLVLELAPNDTDALVAKGAMLVSLPWFLGGDTRQGEELLRAALIRDPAHAEARAYLAAVLRARGASGQAQALEMRGDGAASASGCAAQGAALTE